MSEIIYSEKKCSSFATFRHILSKLNSKGGKSRQLSKKMLSFNNASSCKSFLRYIPVGYDIRRYPRRPPVAAVHLPPAGNCTRILSYPLACGVIIQLSGPAKTHDKE